MGMRVRTSTILQGLLRDAPGDHVTMAWIIDRLGERSFGIVMLLIALVGLLLAAPALAGLLLAVPTIQIVMARQAPALPRFMATHRLPTQRLVSLFKRMVPLLRRLEYLVRPRWAMPFKATKRVVGFIILLLCVTLLAPIPFNHVIPILVNMLRAFAFLGEDSVLQCIALLAAAMSLTIKVATV